MPEQERGIEITQGTLRRSPLEPQQRLSAEGRALALGDDASGGFAVPKQLDGQKVRPTGHWDDPQSDQADYGFTGQPKGRDA